MIILMLLGLVNTLVYCQIVYLSALNERYRNTIKVATKDRNVL
jgi:hypothetical protein